MNGRLKYLLSAALLIACGVYLYFHADELQILDRLEGWEVFAIAGLIIAFTASTALTFWLLVRLLDVVMTGPEVLALTLFTNAVNYIAPARPGAAAKAAYLRTTRNLPYSEFAAVLAANGFVVAGLSGIVGMATLLWSYPQATAPPMILWVVCVGLLAGGVLPFLLPLPRIAPTSRLRRILALATNGFRRIRNRRGGMIAAAASVLLQHLLAALIIYAVYRAIGHSVPYHVAFMIGVFTAISNLFAITPNNIGTQEVVVAWLSSLSDVSFAVGIAAAGIIRAVHVALTAILGPLSLHWLLRRPGFEGRGVLSWRN